VLVGKGDQGFFDNLQNEKKFEKKFEKSLKKV
jgi:hypothetical protein